MFTSAREGDSKCVCVSVVLFVCAYRHASALKSRRCCCAAVANKFVKLHSQFAVFLCSRVASGATNKETPQYVSWSPQSTTARPLTVPLFTPLSFSIFLPCLLLLLRSSLPMWQLLHISFYCHVSVHFVVFVVSLYGRSPLLVFLQKLFPSYIRHIRETVPRDASRRQQ